MIGMTRRRGFSAPGLGPKQGWAAFAGAAMLIVSAAAVPAWANKAEPAGRSLETLRQMAAAGDRDDCPTVLKLGVPLVDGAGRSGLTDEMQALAYELVVSCEARAKANAAAYAHALKATELENSSDYLWRVRLLIEFLDKKDEAA